MAVKHRLSIVRLLFVITTIALWAVGALAQTRAADDEEGSVSLLVKTTVPLTPEVIADISSLKTVRVSQAWPEIRAMAIQVNASKASELSAHPLVERVEPDLIVGFEPSDPGEAQTAIVPETFSTVPIQTWNQDMADTPGSGWTGAGVTVAVVDAGLPQNWQEFLPAGSVDVEHGAGFGAEGWGDFHNPVHAVRGVGGHIGLFPHGLAVSSVIVGFPSEFGPIGGAAPGARILPIRVLNQFNFGWFSWFTAGILHVAQLKASGAIPGPMVINFSIQATGYSQTLTDAIDYAISQGVLFVTIAGNFYPSDFVSFPGRLPQSITAGAVGWRSEGTAPTPWFFADVPENDASQAYVAPFSGREAPFVPPASQIDVLAPGSFVFGEWIFGPGFSEGRAVGFEAMSNFIFGTSFAAPHVAGIVAQMLEKNPALTQAQAEAILRSTALPVPASASSFWTPLGIFVYPWDARATGTGLARGAVALAATPAAAAAGGLANGGRHAEAGAAIVPARAGARLVSRLGRVPVELEWGALAQGASAGLVLDAQGRVVRRWRAEASSTARAIWDGRDENGTHVGRGVYFVRLEAAGRTATAKTVVMGE